ncbi:MAG TPA: tetratricopeptide repeat protein [Polyangiaceae bacterium]
MPRFLLAPTALAAALLFLSPAGRAQSQTGVALAETLYQQARDLMAEGRYDEACPKLEESQRLDPATGTLLNLASCHEHQGRLATAWFEYLDAVTLARRDGRPDRVAYAQGRLAELEPKLSRLTLVVPEAADYPGLELELDGTRIGKAARGVPAPVDPGAHVVEVRAPGRQSIKLSIEIGTVPEQKTLTIPELAPTTPEPAPVVVPAPQSAEPAPADRASPGRPIPTTAYVAGAVTAGLLAGAVVTGVLYTDRKDDYEHTHSEADYDAARTLLVANAVLWIGVATGAGLTTYLYVTRPAEVPGVASASGLPHGAIAHFAGRF